MAGIYGVLLKESKIEKFYEQISSNPIVNEHTFSDGIVGRSVIDKLVNKVLPIFCTTIRLI